MAYPKELRERVIARDATGDSQTEIAEELAVSIGWINKVVQCYATFGELFPPRKKSGRPPKFSEEDREFLRGLVAENPNLTLVQFAAKISEHPGFPVSHANIFDAFKAMGYSHKKTGNRSHLLRVRQSE
jgi:transposase